MPHDYRRNVASVMSAFEKWTAPAERPTWGAELPSGATSVLPVPGTPGELMDGWDYRSAPVSVVPIINVFPALPNSASVEVGRVRMPNGVPNGSAHQSQETAGNSRLSA